ncbi:MAG: polysaccharide biosynthesis tyrosine autokinase [Acidobacteriota bacterium]
MRNNGVSGRPNGIGPEDGSRMLTRITPQAGAIPVYQMPQSGDYVYESEDRNQLIRTLRRRRLSIACAAVMGTLVGVALALTSTPVYRASTSLQLEGFDDTFLRDLRQLPPMFPNGPPESYIRNQVKLLQSDTLALRVANRLGIEPKPDQTAGITVINKLWSILGRKPLSPEQEAIATVQRAMKVITPPQTQVIEVQYDSPDAESAAKCANAVAAEFIALNRETRFQFAQDTTEWLSKQTADLKNKVETGNNALQEFARTAGLVFAGNHSTLAEDRMRQLQDALTKAETDRAAKFARYQAALSSDTASLPDLVVTGPLRQYQTDLQGLRRQLADMKAIYTPAYYKVAQMEAQIASLELAITKERQAIIERLKNEYEASVQLERTLGEKNTGDLRGAQDLNEKENHYNLQKREVDANQQLYESTLQKVKEAGVNSAMRSTNIQVLDPARAPANPHSPNLPLYVVLGFTLGGLGGVGLVLYREPSDRVTTPADATILDVPLLGVIPSALDDRGLSGTRPGPIRGGDPNGNLALVTWQQERSLLSESFRTTLASILFGFQAAPPGLPSGRVLVIASREPCEGKTTVLTNLGIALAETDRRVLLIDADLRRPTLHKYFGITGRAGLSDVLQTPYLIDELHLDTIVQKTAVQNLWVLPSGPLVEAFPKLLYSENLTRLLERFRSEFDLILIDTPPVELYPESRVLGRISDGVVIVVRANRASRAELRTTYMRFVQDDIPILGTILNDWRIDKSEYRAYGEHYSRYDRPSRRRGSLTE